MRGPANRSCKGSGARLVCRAGDTGHNSKHQHQQERRSAAPMQTDKEPSSSGMTWVLALMFALVIGGIHEAIGGYAVGALLGVLLAQVLHLRTRTRALSQQLKTLNAVLEALADQARE